MYRQDIVVGQEYGYREKPQQKGSLERVRVLDRVRSQWKVEWLDPNRGLQDFVKSNHLVIPWPERKEFLRDEASWDTLERYCDTYWPGFEHPLSDAVDTILESTGELISIGKCGDLSCEPEVLRACRRESILGSPYSATRVHRPIRRGPPAFRLGNAIGASLRSCRTSHRVAPGRYRGTRIRSEDWRTWQLIPSSDRSTAARWLGVVPPMGWVRSGNRSSGTRNREVATHYRGHALRASSGGSRRTSRKV